MSGAAPYGYGPPELCSSVGHQAGGKAAAPAATREAPDVTLLPPGGPRTCSPRAALRVRALRSRVRRDVLRRDLLRKGLLGKGLLQKGVLQKDVRKDVLRNGVLAGALAVGIAGCGGAKIESSPATGSAPAGSGTAGATGGPACGTLDLAVNPWVGYEANAAVVAEVAETRLGCTVVKKDLKEEISWQGFGTGEVDAVVENWAHDDLRKKYVTGQKTAVELGPTGGTGVIGWFVPPWMAAEYPDITDYRNLDKYAELFKTSESGGKGQLLDGDPSFVTNDEALVKNLDLDYEVVYAGSEAALITAFRKAEAEKTPLLGYFYDPQWFMSEVPLVKVDLPAYTEGCDAVPEEVACDYPEYQLDKIASKSFVDSGSPAVDLIRKFTISNEDQNVIARYIAEDRMSPDDAAEKWIADNPDKVDAWLS